MKKILMLMLGALSALPVFARVFEYTYEGQTLKYTVIDEVTKICQTKAGDSYGDNTIYGDLVIPETASDGTSEYSVIRIGAKSFYKNSQLTSVVIPNSVTTICECAFAGTGLLSVRIPESVTSIESFAFCDSDDLIFVSLPGSITTIADYTFLNCRNLTSIVIPNSVITIGKEAFFDCIKLSSVKLSNSLRIIGQSAFFGCEALTSVVIPNSVTTIEQQAFDYCIGLTSVVLGSSVKNIGTYAFSSYTYDERFTQITSLSLTPPQCEDNAFEYVATNATLYVPEQAISDYQRTAPWKNFQTIAAVSEKKPEFSERYRIVSGPLTADEVMALPDNSKVVVKTHSRGQFGWWKAVTLNEETGEGYFIHRDTETPLTQETFDRDYVYNVTVTDNSLLLMNSKGRYLPKAETVSNNTAFSSNVTAEADAERLSIITNPVIESTSSCAGMYVFRASTTSAGANHSDLHLAGAGDYFVPKYYPTADGGLKQPSDNSTKTVAASAFYLVESIPDYEPTEWYRLLNRETGSQREWSYLGYYPTDGDAAWFIYNKVNGQRNEQIKSDFITCGDFAGERTEATREQINGQLWAWVEGNGANAGKYCLVNKTNPKGAVSNLIVNNDGEEVTAATDATNTSRWLYVADRMTQPDLVCWFDLSDSTTVDGATYVCPTFVNQLASEATHITVAGSGQKYQVMRYGNKETASWWLMTPESFDAVSDFNAAVAAHAAGFESMKDVIGGESISATAPYSTTPENIEALAEAAVSPYAARFDKKIVRLENMRRHNQNLAKPWLGAADNNGTANIQGIATTANGADLWLMLVNDNCQVTLRSLATGHNVSQATDATVSAGSEANTVMFKVGSNYMNLHPSNANVTQWSDANDTGSMWFVTLANDAFASPAAGEQYYRIVSDRWLSEAQSPNLAINGENRDDCGEGEVITRAAYGHSGNYWRIQEGSTEGSVKLVNLVDEYALGGESEAVQQADGNDYYLEAIGDLGYGIKSADSSDGSVYLNVNAADETLGLTNNASTSPAVNSNFNNSGAMFYFLPADNDEIAAATERYVAAVAARITGSSITDDTDNIVALVGKEKAAKYVEAIQTAGNLTTINAVNTAKRNHQGANMTSVVIDAVNEIIAEHLGLQHVQFSSTKDSWDRHYLGLNASGNLQGTDNVDESTLWTIIPAEGGYKLLNEQQQMFVGGKTGMNSNNANGHYPMVDEGNAAIFTLGYNAGFAAFYLCENPHVPQGDNAVIHLADNNGSIKNWNIGAGSNSHWYLHALGDATCMVASVDEEAVKFTLFGELTEMAAANGMVITVAEVGEPQGSRRRAAAAVHTVTTDDIDSDNSFTLPLTDGNWKVSVPGGMLRTANGHTRAADTVFEIKGTTGISEVGTEPGDETKFYDLTGRRVATPTRKGIYISKGCKHLVK